MSLAGNSSGRAGGALSGNLAGNPGGDPILDQLDATPVAAYSPAWLLRSSYSGALVNVRESSGDTDADIGVSSGVLDQIALASHVGANNGFVNTLYDQMGGYNYTQTASDGYQPQIASSGAILTDNGAVLIRADGTDDYLEAADAYGLEGTDPDLTIFALFKASGSTANQDLLYLGPSNPATAANDALAVKYDLLASPYDLSWRTYGSNRIFDGGGATTSWHTLCACRASGDQTGEMDIEINGVALTEKSSSNPTTTITLNATSVARLFTNTAASAASSIPGDLVMLLVFNSILSAADKAKLAAYVASKGF